MSSIEYKRYRRSQIAELADWTPGFDMAGVSVSDADKQAGSPKHGDKIARNPANHADRWLVAADYFAANFEAAIKAAQPQGWRSAYAVISDEDAELIYGSYDKQQCNDHINDAISEYDIPEAAKWKVVPIVVLTEQPERVSVPREPTPEMWDAAWNSIGLPYRAKLSMHEIKTLFDKFHSAMLAAAPKEEK